MEEASDEFTVRKLLPFVREFIEEVNSPFYLQQDFNSEESLPSAPAQVAVVNEQPRPKSSISNGSSWNKLKMRFSMVAESASKEVIGEGLTKRFSVTTAAAPKDVDLVNLKAKDREEYQKKIIELNGGWKEEMFKRINCVFGVEIEKLIPLEESVLEEKGDDEEKLISFLIKLLAISIPDYGFDSRMAQVMDKLRSVISVGQIDQLKDYFKKVEGQLSQQLKESYLKEQQDLDAQKDKTDSRKKKMIAGIGALAGGIALGLTAGMAAPIVLPVFATLLGAAFLTGVTATTLFVAVFGVGGAGLTKYKIDRRYQEVADFTFVPIKDAEQLRIAIGISGWIREEEDLEKPWLVLDTPGTDVFIIKCHLKEYQELGSAIQKTVSNSAVKMAAFQAMKTTALKAAVGAMMWPATVLGAARLIDNPWSVCVNIAEKEGLILASVIKKRVHGHRPLTLCGYSLGALTIHVCLQELAKEPELSIGCILNVVMCGAPILMKHLTPWYKSRSLIAGRFIHCYSRNDWVLKYLFRGSSLSMGDVAGLGPITGIDGIENVDLSEFVEGHLEYAEKMPEIISNLNLN